MERFEPADMDELLGRNERIRWFKRLHEVYESKLTEEEKRDLHKWEEANRDGRGRTATNEWPGWRKHIGPPPWVIESN